MEEGTQFYLNAAVQGPRLHCADKEDQWTLEEENFLVFRNIVALIRENGRV